MTGNMRLADVASGSFALLSTQDISADALGAAAFGVVLDPVAGPVALVTVQDLATSTLPPAVLADGDSTLREFTGSAAIRLLDLPGVRGLVLLDAADHVLGIVPIEVIDYYLGTGPAMSPSVLMGPGGDPGDGALGAVRRSPRAIVRCAAPGCGFPRTIVIFSRDSKGPCQHPDLPAHDLVVPRR